MTERRLSTEKSDRRAPREIRHDDNPPCVFHPRMTPIIDNYSDRGNKNLQMFLLFDRRLFLRVPHSDRGSDDLQQMFSLSDRRSFLSVPHRDCGNENLQMFLLFNRRLFLRVPHCACGSEHRQKIDRCSRSPQTLFQMLFLIVPPVVVKVHQLLIYAQLWQDTRRCSRSIQIFVCDKRQPATQAFGILVFQLLYCIDYIVIAIDRYR